MRKINLGMAVLLSILAITAVVINGLDSVQFAFFAFLAAGSWLTMDLAIAERPRTALHWVGTGLTVLGAVFSIWYMYETW